MQRWHERPSTIWAGHSCTAAFSLGVSHVCFAIQRFQYHDVARKLHTPLLIPRTCLVPQWSDMEVVWCQYAVCAIICHEGDTPMEVMRMYFPLATQSYASKLQSRGSAWRVRACLAARSSGSSTVQLSILRGERDLAILNIGVV